MEIQWWFKESVVCASGERPCVNSWMSLRDNIYFRDYLLNMPKGAEEPVRVWLCGQRSNFSQGRKVLVLSSFLSGKEGWSKRTESLWEAGLRKHEKMDWHNWVSRWVRRGCTNILSDTEAVAWLSLGRTLPWTGFLLAVLSFIWWQWAWWLTWC